MNVRVKMGGHECEGKNRDMNARVKKDDTNVRVKMRGMNVRVKKGAWMWG